MEEALSKCHSKLNDLRQLMGIADPMPPLVATNAATDDARLRVYKHGACPLKRKRDDPLVLETASWC